jgi:hypothetical protein
MVRQRGCRKPGAGGLRSLDRAGRLHFWTSWSAAQSVPLEARYEQMQRRGAGVADGPFPDIAACQDRDPQVGHAAQAFLLAHQAAAPVSARPACMAARRRGRVEDHARRRSGHRRRADAFGAALVLVDCRRAARKHRRKRRRKRIRRQAAVRTGRLADPAFRRRLGEGIGPDAPRGALRRDKRPGRRPDAGRPARLSPQWLDTDRRSAGSIVLRTHALREARRTAGQRQGPLAEDHRGVRKASRSSSRRWQVLSTVRAIGEPRPA